MAARGAALAVAVCVFTLLVAAAASRGAGAKLGGALRAGTAASRGAHGPADKHSCGHELISRNEERWKLRESPQEYVSHPWDSKRAGGRRKLHTTDFQNIRIHVDTSQVSVEDRVKREILLNFLIPNSIDYLQKALRVVPISGKLKLSSGVRFGGFFDTPGYCGDARVPDEHNTVGVDADFVLYVTTMSTEVRTLAYAAACRQDQYGRPIAGNINYNPLKIRTGIPDREDVLATTTHEIMHTLGFSDDMYGSFRDERGEVRGRYNVVRVNAFGRAEIVLPTVVKMARNYFDCPSMTGAPLESQGGFGTAGSHWEKRAFMNELMTPSKTLNPIYSSFTFGLLQDSGWYMPDYRYTTRLEWGRGAGCSFLFDVCMRDGNSTNPKWFCDREKTMQCTYDRVAKGYCFIKKYPQEIPAEYQYFDDPTKGGGLDLADYCPIMAFYQIMGTNRTTDCRQPVNFPTQKNFYGEHYCTTCRCFEHNRMARKGVKTKMTTGCYLPKCDQANRTYQVLVGRTWLQCSSEGGTIEPPVGYQGTFECSPFDTICGGPAATCPSQCSGRGNCVDGKCYCVPGWMGDDCGQEICPWKCFTEEGRGQCVSNGQWPPKCECNTGYTGESCRDEAGVTGASTGLSEVSDGNEDETDPDEADFDDNYWDTIMQQAVGPFGEDDQYHSERAGEQNVMERHSTEITVAGQQIPGGSFTLIALLVLVGCVVLGVVIGTVVFVSRRRAKQSMQAQLQSLSLGDPLSERRSSPLSPLSSQPMVSL
eukprot:tig00021433_g21272.t1